MSVKSLYSFAKEYLLRMLPESLSPSDLDKYFIGDNCEAASLKDVYLQIIGSAQNYQSMPNVIKFADRKDTIGDLLFDYDYHKVKDIDPEELYKKFRKTFHVTSTDCKRNSWYKWSCSIVDAACFIDEFKDINDFRNFVKQFDYNTATRIALPLLISTRIKGVGFALACDLLKELGYLNYPKPDIHMMDICESLGLSSRDPISVFEAIVKAADEGNTTPYELDKILWLICSGNFYLDGVKASGHKKDFIAAAQNQ